MKILAVFFRQADRTPRFSVLAVFFFLLALNPLFVLSSHAQSQCNGTPSVFKSVYPPTVEAGDPVTVFITVGGCSGEVSEPIPFDGVLLIDMSNSMDDDPPYSDPNDLRIDAAISFVNCVAADSELAIVTFSTNANLVQAMTSDQPLLVSQLDGLRGQADGSTNMYDGMVLAQQQLTSFSSGERERYIILLSDGEDNSGHSAGEFVTLVNNAAINDIHYLTIALGSQADTFSLITFAELTNGQWFESTDASQLQGVYDTICTLAGSIAKTRNIELHESLSAGVEVVPGSIISNIPFTAGQIAGFESSGQIVGDIGTLGSAEGAFLQFDVTSDCLTPDSEQESVEVVVDDASSKVTYAFGVHEGEVPVPERTFECTRPGDLRINKEYDFVESRLYITLESRYLPGADNNIIKNIVVIERPSTWFQASPASASPSLSYLFPGSQNDTLVWEIAELDPQEIITLSVYLEPMACSENYHPPIPVNATKYTGGDPGRVVYVRPDGTRGEIVMPFEEASLSDVDPCDGRPDLMVVPDFSFSEYRNPPALHPMQVLYKHESPWMWVDSEVGNGFWNGVSENVGDYIRGAELVSPTNVPVDRRITVQGNGDYFFVDAKNTIYIKVANVGNRQTQVLDPGAKLLVYNHATHHWDMLRAEAMQTLEANDEKLIEIKVLPNAIQPEHIRAYALPPLEAMNIIRTLDPNLAGRIRSWANNNPSQWDTLVNQPAIVPQNLLDILPDECPFLDPFCWFSTTLQDRFEQFLTGQGIHMAWGKPSINVSVLLATANLEKHTHNNSSSEIIIIGQPY
jgi:hypothetical protein